MNPDSMLREVKVEDAVGMVLAHDLTQIIPGQFKGRLFHKGHVITEQDIPSLLNIGKEHIYIMELQQGYLHEDEAAGRMARAVCGNHIVLSSPHEGKVTLKSEIHGLAYIHKPFIDEVNRLGEIAMATVKSDTVVQPGQALVGTRVIPLIVEESKIATVERLAAEYGGGGQALVSVKPFRSLKVGLITTGSEVFKGRIQDKFGPVVRNKVAAFGSEVIEQRLVSDDMKRIVEEIHYFKDAGCELILVTGGMSVDPDDRTPGAIKASGAEIVSYGTPMLPGSMLMMAYLDGIPIMGLPGCVMHDPYTSFDVLLPRVCAGEVILREDIVAMGYGGMQGC
ncbi:molybdopterin-binding protein [Paenibacillus swuensis]|uniref:Molybdopterin molybdenumtransferase n=1 Tax=Paenibacillus swuensis TaxID=1178515 RepID=A0A172TJ20_9BACL|nr:molybdopterin-binding protein [Paenibacillus swuensis]ANE47041.1 molybdopterin-binding protein [Paenibacillus swuensis]